MSKFLLFKSLAQLCRDGLDGLVFWMKYRTIRPQDRRFFSLHYGQICALSFRVLGFAVPLKLYSFIAAKVVGRTELFDADYYLQTNTDVAKAGIDPVIHYCRYGDAEGRRPNPLFDPRFYRSRAKCSSGINSLLHYCWVGRYQKMSPSAWFDAQYYIQNNRDVERRGFDPLVHYLRWGGVEGRSPNPSFDGNFYLRTYPEIKAARINPLLHYIEIGRFEGRISRPLDEQAGAAVPFSVNWQPGAWAELASRIVHKSNDAQVTVVIPVYRDRLLTWGCLASVLTASNQISFRILVIDDASPESELSADMDEMARRGWIELLRNERNLGFVASVNRGVTASNGQDVVLLNSDTEVYPGWLDRLHQAAWRHPRTASVTPISNNATIASYPRFLHDNPYPLETDYPTLDRLAARVNAGVEIEVPTGVGFCMYLRHDAIGEVGIFNEKAFGKGYGEENDWCQRAIQKGWRNIIAPDIFVRHLGGASFRDSKDKLIASAMRVLAKKHPHYHNDVQEFIINDPLADARQRLDWERLKRQARNENVLMVCHHRGGGTERHLQEDSQRLQEEGKGVFYLRPDRGNPDRVRIAHPACRQLMNQKPFELAHIKQLAAALKELRITRIHSHGLVDFSAEAPKHLLSLAQALNIPLHVDIHDYKVICPRINLVDNDGLYCNEPDETSCNACLTKNGNEFGVSDIRKWRTMHRRVLMAAEAIWVPDEDVAQRLLRYYPEIKCHVAPHESLDLTAVSVRRPNLHPDEHLRVVVIGGISKIKGYHVLLAAAKDAQKKRLPIKFIVMGYSLNDRMLEKAGVQVTGRYQENESEYLLHSLMPHAVWLPSVWPETYSYTLSLAIKNGYPVFAFNLGAIGRRLRESGKVDMLWPLSMAKKPIKINERLMKYYKLNSGRSLCLEMKDRDTTNYYENTFL